MDLVDEALRAPGRAPQRSARGGPVALLVGGGGALGSAVLEQLLGRGRFVPLRVLVTRAFHGSVRGLEPLLVEAFDGAGSDDHAVPPPHHRADLAVVVFDRARHANGREEAFVRAEPPALPALARWLRRQGVRHLLVVMPHAPAGLPQALKVGLATLDEQAVTTLGFDHVVFVRTAQSPHLRAGLPRLQRLADALLRQLQLMLPAAHKPMQVHKVAAVVAELARLLPGSSAGTRVLPPELMWQAAQGSDPGALLAAWLAGAELPPISAPRMRL
jgi:hypothetical protein